MAADERTPAPHDPTRLAGAPTPRPSPPTAAGGWLTSSGSIDHGQFEPGAVLENRYRIIGLLGRGGMGEVYRADDLRLGQQVALKFLPPGLATDASRLVQFHAEVRTARQVSHPNVCRVYDIGDLGGRLYLSMEYVDGEDLASLLRRIGRLPEDKALDVARQICAGLAAAHERGILHRDLKPANIMIDGAGKARVMDFSLAAAGEVTDVRSGTPAYMAPEQLAGREVSVRSDIYALGLVLYELFTGHRTSEGATTMADLVALRESGSVTAPTEFVKTLDPAIERAILRCLETDPARRPTSALAVSASLPGGDPLAAALAAGETPSPEMVAAAGGDAAVVSPIAGLLLLVVTAILVIGAAGFADRIGLLPRIPLPKSPPVLTDRAADIRQRLGYAEPQADSAVGFVVDTRYLEWADKLGAGATHWASLASGRPAALRFFARWDRRAVIPYNPLLSPTWDDPPLDDTGMTEVETDTLGNLILFRALPPEVDAPADRPSGTTDWTPVIVAAGFDPATLTAATPTRTPVTVSDERRAWRTRVPGTAIDVQLEAAAYRGKPVFFQLVSPWTVPLRDTAGLLRTGNNRTVFGIVFVLSALSLAAGLARRNLQSGRADRRGAFRLGAVTFFLRMAVWVLAPHVHDASAETDRLFTAIGIALFVAAVLYLLYLAVEPFVRRSWPTMLIGWSRALAASGRDPIVGRDVLVGVAAGAALAAMTIGNTLVPRLLGHADPSPWQINTNTLLGVRPELAEMFNAADSALENALLDVLLLAGCRALVQRVLSRANVSPKRVDDIFITLTVVSYTLLQLPGTASGALLQTAIFTAVTTGLAFVVMLRVGLFAAAIMFLVDNALERAPITLDPNQFYSSAAWAVMIGAVLLSIWGLWMARAGEGLFGVSARRPA